MCTLSKLGNFIKEKPLLKQEKKIFLAGTVLWWSLPHGKCFGCHWHMVSDLVVTIMWQVFWLSLTYGDWFGGHYHMTSALVVTVIWQVLWWLLSHDECFGSHYHMTSALVFTVIWWGLEEVSVRYLLILKQCTIKEAAILGTGTHWEVCEVAQSVKHVDWSLGPQHSGGKADCGGTYHPLDAVQLEKWGSVKLPGQFLHLSGWAPGSVKNPVSTTKADTWQISTFGLCTSTYVHTYLHGPVCKQTNVYTYIHEHKILNGSFDCVFFVSSSHKNHRTDVGSNASVWCFKLS